jgi:hypothetical protein
MIKRLSIQEELQLKWKEVYEKIQAGTYSSEQDQAIAYMSARYHESEKREEAERQARKLTGYMDRFSEEQEDSY